MAILAIMPFENLPATSCSFVASQIRNRLCSFLVMAGWVIGASVAFAQGSLPEFKVKAAYLINFPKYVEWPATAFAGTNSPIIIAVVGETKVTAELQKIIAGRTINGRNVVLKHLAANEVPVGVHVLFISASEQQNSPSLLAKVKDGGVLTVGESDDFPEHGGIINLVRRNQNIVMEVNLTAAHQARIKISSKLLELANVVKGRTN